MRRLLVGRSLRRQSLCRRSLYRRSLCRRSLYRRSLCGRSLSRQSLSRRSLYRRSLLRSLCRRSLYRLSLSIIEIPLKVKLLYSAYLVLNFNLLWSPFMLFFYIKNLLLNIVFNITPIYGYKHSILL